MPPELDAGGDVTAQTRAVAQALYDAMEDVARMDALIAPGAAWWTQAAGVLDRANFVAAHQPYTSRPAPLSRRKRLLGIIAQGNRAAIEIEWEVVWPDVTYHQFYHHALIVENGQIQSMREYCDIAQAKKLYSVLLSAKSG